MFEIYGRVALTGQKEKFEYALKPLNLWLNVSVYSPRKGYFAAILEDITERKRTAEALADSEELYRTLIETAAEGIVIAKPDGTHLFVNNKLAEMFGYTIDELLSKPSFELMSKEEQKRQALHMRNNLENNLVEYGEFEFCRKDGSILWAACNASPLKDETGNHIANISMFNDITERKINEEKLKENQESIKSINEKLHVVGSLTRHDVSNKLSAVNGYTYLLKKKHKDEADIVEAAVKIEQAVADSAKIFEFARLYESLGAEKLIQVDVGKTLEEAASLFKDLKFKIVNDCSGRMVLADSFLRQMFYNFIDNTRKYGQNATVARVYFDQEEQGGLRLTYEDNGVGISTENKPRLFTEGFSVGGSTGFGLFLIKKMMHVYGWTITEEGEPGKGAKFIIRLPSEQH